MLQAGRPPLRYLQANLGVLAGVALATTGAYGIYSYSTRSSNRQVFGNGPALTSLRLHSIDTFSPDTKRFRFELPDPQVVSGLSLTSAVLTLTKPEGRLWPVVRPYTPVNDLDEPGYLDLLVKKYPDGKVSNHIHSLKPGQSLFFLGALKAYRWKTNEFQQIALIAGGAGITPIYQLIRGIMNNPEEKTKITLVFGINNDADALFRDEFTRYEQKFPDRFKVVYTVTNPTPDSPYKKGRITVGLLRDVIGNSNEKNQKIFLCGPPAMEDALVGSAGLLGALGYSKDQIFKF